MTDRIKKKYLGDTKKLYECVEEARAFALAEGEWGPYIKIDDAYNYLLQFTNSKKCFLCERPHIKDSDYCSFDCAEEDGAIEK